MRVVAEQAVVSVAAPAQAAVHPRSLRAVDSAKVARAHVTNRAQSAPPALRRGPVPVEVAAAMRSAVTDRAAPPAPTVPVAPQAAAR